MRIGFVVFLVVGVDNLFGRYDNVSLRDFFGFFYIIIDYYNVMVLL